jgi:hypothetical protein
MGHQVTFYATPADTDRIEGALRAALELSVVHSKSAAKEPRVASSAAGDPRSLFYHLSRTCDLPLIKMDHVPALGYWAVDVIRSPVVEFSVCFFDGKLLRAGRAYYVDGFHDDSGIWTEKSPEFRAWAKRVLSALKKALTKRGASYFGPDALRWLETSGARLE